MGLSKEDWALKAIELTREYAKESFRGIYECKHLHESLEKRIHELEKMMNSYHSEKLDTLEQKIEKLLEGMNRMSQELDDYGQQQ